MVASPPVFYLFYRNRHASWHSFPDITYIKVNNAPKLAIFHLIEVIFFGIYLYLKPHIFTFCFMVSGNGLANWHGFSHTRHIKGNMADSRPLWIWSSWNFSSGRIYQIYYTWNCTFFFSNGLAIWQGLLDIRVISAHCGRWSAI